MSHKFSKAFTLIELMVSVAIMGAILTVVALNQSHYGSISALTALADDLSVNIREAQVYGVAVKELTPGSSVFSASYGVSLSLLSQGSNTSYISFADRDGDSIYDNDWTCPTDSSSECLKKVSLSRGNYISSICTITTGGENCSSPKRVDISFLRPDINATIKFFNNGGQSYNPNGIIGARIVLTSPDNLTKSVLVYLNGQISVQ